MRATGFAIVVVGLIVAAAASVAAGTPQPEDHEGRGLSDSQARFVLGNTLWTLVHEMGHALIAELDIPVLGQEEDAADRIASIALLLCTLDHTHGPDEAPRLADAAEAWRLEWLLDRAEGEPAPYWDNHSLDIQRYYNIVCLLHAHNPELLAERPTLDLPGQRALSCDDYEYEQAARSVRQVVEIYGRKPDQDGQPISVRYEKPTSDRHAALGELVKRSGIAEHVAEQTQQLFAMPRQIRIVLAPCFGDASAFWRSDLREIVFCYELLDRFVYLHSVRACVAGKAEDLDEVVPACI